MEKLVIASHTHTHTNKMKIKIHPRLEKIKTEIKETFDFIKNDTSPEAALYRALTAGVAAWYAVIILSLIF